MLLHQRCHCCFYSLPCLLLYLNQIALAKRFGSIDQERTSNGHTMHPHNQIVRSESFSIASASVEISQVLSAISPAFTKHQIFVGYLELQHALVDRRFGSEQSVQTLR